MKSFLILYMNLKTGLTNKKEYLSSRQRYQLILYILTPSTCVTKNSMTANFEGLMLNVYYNTLNISQLQLANSILVAGENIAGVSAV